MTQQAREVALGVRALHRFHLGRETGYLAVQALNPVEDVAAFGLAKLTQRLHLSIERRIPIDGATARLGFGQRQEVGVLAGQASGDGGAQLPRGAPDRIARKAERAVTLQRFTDE